MLLRAWKAWTSDIQRGLFTPPRPMPNHECRQDRCVYRVYSKQVFVCQLSGNVHICDGRHCSSVSTHAHEVCMACTITGQQYAFTPIAVSDGETVDFSSKTAMLPQEPKRPGPRPKQLTTSEDDEELQKMARSVLLTLIDASGTKLFNDPALEKRFTDSALTAWRYVNNSSTFVTYKNQYTFSKHCLVLAYWARDEAGFQCKGFTIQHEPKLVHLLVGRSGLASLGLIRDYTSTVKLLRSLISTLEPVP